MSALSWDDFTPVIGDRFGRFDMPCPICGPDRPTLQRQRRTVLRAWREAEDFLSYMCARCGAHGWVKPEREWPLRPRGGKIQQALDQMERQAREADRKAREAEYAQERLRKVWHAEFVFHHAGPIGGTLAEKYFALRGVSPGLDQRFSPFAPWGYDDDAKTGPAVVSAVRDVAGAITGAHAVFLRPDGSKIDRRSFGQVMGHAIQLAAPEDGVLAVAEGWETARAFTQLFGVPCWSAISSYGVRSFLPPPGLRKLYVAGDNDLSGHGLQAAQALAKRASESCEVIISLPPPGDWADELQRRSRAAA